MANPDCLLHTALGIDIIATVKLNELGFRAPRPIQYPLAPHRRQFQHTMEAINQPQAQRDPALTQHPSNRRIEYSLTRVVTTLLHPDSGTLHSHEDPLVEWEAVIMCCHLWPCIVTGIRITKRKKPTEMSMER